VDDEGGNELLAMFCVGFAGVVGVEVEVEVGIGLKNFFCELFPGGDSDSGIPTN